MLYNILIRIIRVIDFIFYGFKKPDNSKVPKEGGLIICSNHPAMRDPIYIAESFDRKLTFMAKKELFENKIVGKFLSSFGAFPIDRGNNDISALKTAIRLLKSGHATLIFPQGTRSKKADNTPGKQGAIRLAMLTGAKVIPVGITENNHIFKKVKVNIGEAIDYSEIKKQKPTEEDYERLTQELMDKIYALSDGEKK